jgi:site-specific recombinase XerD
MSDPVAPFLVEPFLEQLHWERNLAPRTVAAYRREVLGFVRFVDQELGRKGPREVTPVDVRAWLAHLHGRRLGARSVERSLAALRTYFAFLLDESAVAANPARAVPHPRRERRIPEVGTLDAVETLLEGFPDTASGRRDRALFELLDR